MPLGAAQLGALRFITTSSVVVQFYGCPLEGGMESAMNS